MSQFPAGPGLAHSTQPASDLLEGMGQRRPAASQTLWISFVAFCSHLRRPSLQASPHDLWIPKSLKEGVVYHKYFILPSARRKLVRVDNSGPPSLAFLKEESKNCS